MKLLFFLLIFGNISEWCKKARRTFKNSKTKFNSSAEAIQEIAKLVQKLSQIGCSPYDVIRIQGNHSISPEIDDVFSECVLHSHQFMCVSYTITETSAVTIFDINMYNRNIKDGKFIFEVVQKLVGIACQNEQLINGKTLGSL